MSDGIEPLLLRIERLERANRTMKFAVAGLLIAFFAIGAAPEVKFPHGPRQIDAQRFNLVTRDGKLLASLGAGPNGGSLAFFDASGRAEMLVGTGAGAPSIGVAAFDGNDLIPGNGNARFVLAVDSNAAGESVFDQNGTTRLSNVLTSNNSSDGTFFYDATGTLRGGIGIGSNGPGVFLDDSKGVARILEGITGDDASSALALLDFNGKPLADLSAAGDDSAASLQILDPSGTPRLQAGSTVANGPQVLLNDAGGSTIWFAPEPAGQ
jgi:hypothetical protein